MHQMKSLSWFDFNIMVPVNNHLTSWKKSITTATLKEVITSTFYLRQSKCVFFIMIGL